MVAVDQPRPLEPVAAHHRSLKQGHTTPRSNQNPTLLTMYQPNCNPSRSLERAFSCDNIGWDSCRGIGSTGRAHRGVRVRVVQERKGSRPNDNRAPARSLFPSSTMVPRCVRRQLTSSLYRVTSSRSDSQTHDLSIFSIPNPAKGSAPAARRHRRGWIVGKRREVCDRHTVRAGRASSLSFVRTDSSEQETQ
jgi:hypothetical protein